MIHTRAVKQSKYRKELGCFSGTQNLYNYFTAVYENRVRSASKFVQIYIKVLNQ